MNAGGARAFELLANPVQRLNRLLIDCFRRHRCDIRTPSRLQNRPCIHPVGLVAPAIRLHIVGRQQLDRMAGLARDPPPRMRRAAGFTDYARRRCIDQESSPLIPIKTIPLQYPSSTIADGHLKQVLC